MDLGLYEHFQIMHISNSSIFRILLLFRFPNKGFCFLEVAK